MEHYFSRKPTSGDRESTFQYHCNGAELRFTSGSGVFSKGGVDFGTNLLLETFLEDVPEGDEPFFILDAGCGIGVVGVVLGKLFPEAQVTLFDINERAVALAKRNLSQNAVKNGTALVSDLFQSVPGKYDKILSNPPIRAGKEVIFALYQGAFDALNPGGAFYVVIQKKQGAESTQNKLAEIFGKCTVLEKKAGYRILKSVKEREVS